MCLLHGLNGHREEVSPVGREIKTQADCLALASDLRKSSPQGYFWRT
jgi:hypothetical protein